MFPLLPNIFTLRLRFMSKTHLHSLPDALIAARLDVVHACSVLPIHLFYLLLAEPWHLHLRTEDKRRHMSISSNVFMCMCSYGQHVHEPTCVRNRSLILALSLGQACALLVCSLWGLLRWAEESEVPQVSVGCHCASSTSPLHYSPLNMKQTE